MLSTSLLLLLRGGVQVRRRLFLCKYRNYHVGGFVGNSEPPTLQMNKVLLVCKTTRYEHEREVHSYMDDRDLAVLLGRRGSDYAGLRIRHEEHTRNLDLILNELEGRGIKYTAIKSSHCSGRVDLTGIDTVISAGGDGTFLTAAALVTDNTPVVGLNTDIDRSKGHLCIKDRHGEEPRSFSHVFDCLQNGRGIIDSTTVITDVPVNAYAWKQRSRIRIEVNTGHIAGPLLLRRRALNDVLFAATHTYDATYCEVGIDGIRPMKQKSSGVLVSTGTGSTAWLTCAARVHVNDVSELLSIAYGKRPDLKESSFVTSEYNKSLKFDASDGHMAYLIRDPIVNGIFELSGPVRGFCHELTIRSRCPDAQIVADGQPFHMKIADGNTIKIDMHPEDNLWTISNLL